MKALVFGGPGKISLQEHAQPRIKEAGDAIVRMIKTTICGTDLHIIKGDVPTCDPGRVLGHEGVGIIEEVGDGVHGLSPGDHVLISCISACGICANCRKGMFSHCATGGWLLGNTIDGTQAEFVRIPHAQTSLYKLKREQMRDALILLSDILPTGYECGVLNGKIEPGNTVVIVGAGPIGLATLLTAQFYTPSKIIVVDPDHNRRSMAEKFGATEAIDPKSPTTVQQIISLTDGLGADVVIEAVGTPAAFEFCQEIVAPGGTIANIGVHGRKADLHLEKLWSHNVSITTRLVDTVSTPMLLKSMMAGKIDADRLISHRYHFSDLVKAYDTFSNAPDTQALKVLIEF